MNSITIVYNCSIPQTVLQLALSGFRQDVSCDTSIALLEDTGNHTFKLINTTAKEDPRPEEDIIKAKYSLEVSVETVSFASADKVPCAMASPHFVQVAAAAKNDHVFRKK